MQPFLPPHTRLAGYEIEALVGKGGMGEVYRARQLSMDRVVAIKVLSPRLARQDPAFAKQFEDEARAAGRLNHPNIIAVHDVGTAPYAPADGEPEVLHYFSMELVDGETVKEVITREGRCPLPLTEAVMVGMAEALVYAEQMGVVHRDIKPDNIMVAPGGLVKLADLGLAQQIGSEEGIESEPGKARRVMGTPLYMSPEQARGLVVDHRSDQYSLGATLFHMLAGQPPYGGVDSKAVMRCHVFEPVPDPRAAGDCPEAWRQLCMRLMAKGVGERFASAADLRTAVRQAVAGIPLAAPRRSRPGTLTPVGSTTASTTTIEPRGSGAFKWVAAAVVLGVAGVGVTFIDWGGKPPPPPTVRQTEEVKPPPEPTAIDPQARVRLLIGRLPADHAEALTQLEAALTDPANADDRLRDLLIAERGRRHKALDEQRRGQVTAQLGELSFIDGQISKGNLTLARLRLDEFAKVKTALTQTRFDDLNARLAGEIAKLAERLLSEGGKAATPAQLDALEQERADAPLDAEIKARIEQVLLARRQELQRLEALAKAAARERQAWKELGETLEPLRFSSQYARLGERVDAVAARMPTPDSRELALALKDLARLAGEADTYLRNYLRSNGVEDMPVRVGGETLKVRITDLGDKEVSYRQGTSTLERRADRQSANLNYDRLLSAAYSVLPSDKMAERRRATVAYSWFWKPGDVRALAAACPKDDALAKAVLTLENHTRLLPINNRVNLDGSQASVVYDFAAVRDRSWLEDFAGSAAYGQRGLAWSSDKPLPANDFSEALLPSLAWKGALPAPCEVEARVLVPPGTFLALIGIECGGQRVRVGFDTRSADGAVAGLLVSNADGTRFTAHEQEAVRAGADGAYTVVFNVSRENQAHQVSVRIGENPREYRPLTWRPAPVPLARGGPVGVVVQAYHTSGKVAVEVVSLAIRGAVPVEK